MVETSDSNAKRLDRIEEKLDRLTDAMVAMARAERMRATAPIKLERGRR